MLDTILYAVSTVFSVIGLVAFVYFVMLRLVRPSGNEIYYELLVFGKEEQNACMRVSFLLSQLISTGNIRFCRIIAVDDGMTVYQRQSLLGAFGKEKAVTICSREEAEKIIFGYGGQSTGNGTSDMI